MNDNANNVGDNASVGDNANTSVNSNTNKTPIKPQTFNFNEGEVVVQKGSGEIKYEYTPDNTQTATSVAYQYRFNNSMKVDMAVSLKSISTTSVTLSYAYSDTKLEDITSSNSVFEAQRISPNATKYIYIVVTPTSTSIPSTFQSSIVWYQGEAGTLSIVANNKTTTQTIVKGQQISEPSVELEEGYILEGWFANASYTTPVSFPLRSQGTKVYAKITIEPNLPSDWLAWDSSTSSYYVTQGTSTLPEEVVTPSTYNDGTHGVANVTSIGEQAFSDCELTSVIIQSGVTTIEKSSFFSCLFLTSITLPSTLTSVGNSAFYGCASLINIDLTNCTSLTSIGNYAFYGCSGLTGVYISDIEAWCKISFGDNGANPLSWAKNLYINNKLVTNLTIPSTITTINDYAFNGCTSLISITIPSSVASIESQAFYNCTSLTSVDLSGCTNLTTIGSAAFQSCTSLTSVTLPSELQGIMGEAFLGCVLLTSITIPSSVSFISTMAFHNCTNLTKVVFENCSGWYAMDLQGSGEEFDIDASLLTSPTTAATYLTGTYCYYAWRRSS